MEKTVDYYMDLPYTVELKFGRVEYRASVKELPGCKASVKASESVGELWRLLKEDQRRRIEELLEFGDKVPEPAGVSVDPFWDNFPGGIEEDEARTILYRDGIGFFPLRVLEELWLRELQGTRLAEVKSGIPHKARDRRQLGQADIVREGHEHPVRLGGSRKGAWVNFDGPRTRHGYKDVELFDQPLRTEAAIVAALTILEASMIEDFDFERLRDALLEYVEAHPELKKKDLGWVLWRELPQDWFSSRKAENDKELKTLDEKLEELNRKKREGKISPKEDQERRMLKEGLPRPSWRWARSPSLWRRSILYMMALFGYRRPEVDDYTLRDQIHLLDNHRKQINKLLEAQKDHMSFLEYGTLKGIPKRVVEQARQQVKAAVLADVAGLRQLDIANELGVEVDHDRYKVDTKIPKIDKLIEDGRVLLGTVLRNEGGWQKRAEYMKAEAEWYRSLSAEEKEVEALAESMGWTVEEARSRYQSSPEAARFMLDASERF